MTYQVAIYANVQNDSELYVAARVRALRGLGYGPDIISELLNDDGSVDVERCLRILVEPLDPWPGVDVMDTTCEHVGEVAPCP